MAPLSSSSFTWAVLEHLLRWLPDDDLLARILSDVPFGPRMPGRVAMLLNIRRIVVDPISEDALSSFELLHQYNAAAAAAPYVTHPSLLSLIQSAYLHVLVGSTLKPLGNGKKRRFYDAVDRIWTKRVGDMLKSYMKSLGSKELRLWKSKMEEAAAQKRNPELRERLLTEWTVEEGLAAVRRFVVEELEMLGETVVETIVNEIFSDCTVDGDEIGGRRGFGELDVGSEGVEVEGGVSDGLGRLQELIEEQTESAGADAGSTESDFVDLSVPTPVDSILEGHPKSDCQDLQHNVKEVICLQKPSESRSQNEPEKARNSMDCSSSAHMDYTVSGGAKGDIEMDKNKTKVLRRSSRNRKPIAETCELEDELSESISNESPSKKLCMPRPETARLSPLETRRYKNASGARKRRKWSVQEEDALRAGVKKHGLGRWKIILMDNPEEFNDRTPGDLKDKWRNIRN